MVAIKSLIIATVLGTAAVLAASGPRQAPYAPELGFRTDIEGCDSDWECPRTDFCNKSTHNCLPKLDNYYSCSRDGACKSGFCSSNGYKCKPRQPAKAACVRDAVCQSNNCASGKCSKVSKPLSFR